MKKKRVNPAYASEVGNPWQNAYDLAASVTFSAYCKFSGSSHGREFGVKLTLETEECQLRIGSKA